MSQRNQEEDYDSYWVAPTWLKVIIAIGVIVFLIISLVI